MALLVRAGTFIKLLLTCLGIAAALESANTIQHAVLGDGLIHDNSHAAVQWEVAEDVAGMWRDPEGNHTCRTIYTAAMQSLFEESNSGMQGSAMVLGAYDGKKFDPATEMFNFWFQTPQLRKVFVEPVPPLFAQLTENTASISNVTLVNQAVRLNDATPTIELFCWDVDQVRRDIRHGNSSWPRKVQKPKEYWRALCSTDRAEILTRANVPAADLSDERKAASSANLERYIVSYTVQASTVAELVSKHALQDARYLQIDVEGLDKMLVKSLPLGVDGFMPKVILYEEEGIGDPQLVQYLESRGYSYCCCFWHSGNNAVAVRKEDANRSLLRRAAP